MVDEEKIREVLDKAIYICVKSKYDRCMFETPEFVVCKKECLDPLFLQFLDWKLVNIVGSDTHVIEEAHKNCKKDRLNCIVDVYGRDTCKLECLLREIINIFKEFEKVGEKKVGIY